MTDPTGAPAASAAVEADGWRLVLTSIATSVPVTSLQQAIEVAAAAAAACGPDADTHLRADVRAERVDLALQDAVVGEFTGRDVELAHAITAAIRGAGLTVAPATTEAGGRPVQLVELAIDALDIAAIRPFWKAVLAYVDDPLGIGHQAAPLIDPARAMPGLWFQQMAEPRPQRNRIHLDIAVAHDEAPRRVQAALDAGGVLVSDRRARSFWILADVEGNEICVCTWQDRE